MNRRSNILLRYIALATLTCLISSCFSSSPPPRPKPAPAKPHYSMESYLQQLSLLSYSLSLGQQEPETKAQLNIIQSFAAQKEQVAVYQPAIIVAYRLKRQKGTHTLVAPFNLLQQTSDFPELLEVLQQLNGVEYVMEDAHPVVLKSLPAHKLKFPAKNAVKSKAMIDQELSMLLSSKKPLAAIEEAKVQLRLLQFSITNHLQDIGYIAEVDATHALAAAEAEGSDDDEIKRLSAVLDVRSAELYKEMPFTIDTITK